MVALLIKPAINNQCRNRVQPILHLKAITWSYLLDDKDLVHLILCNKHPNFKNQALMPFTAYTIPTFLQ